MALKALEVLFSSDCFTSVLFEDFTDYPDVIKWKKDVIEEETDEKYAIYAALRLFGDESDKVDKYLWDIP